MKIQEQFFFLQRPKWTTKLENFHNYFKQQCKIQGATPCRSSSAMTSLPSTSDPIPSSISSPFSPSSSSSGSRRGGARSKRVKRKLSRWPTAMGLNRGSSCSTSSRKVARHQAPTHNTRPVWSTVLVPKSRLPRTDAQSRRSMAARSVNLHPGTWQATRELEILMTCWVVVKFDTLWWP